MDVSGSGVAAAMISYLVLFCCWPKTETNHINSYEPFTLFCGLGEGEVRSVTNSFLTSRVHFIGFTLIVNETETYGGTLVFIFIIIYFR